MDTQTHCNFSRKYEYFLTSTAKKLSIPTDTLKGRISNAATIIFSHLITVPLISYILLINFMRSNGILSYELLTELYFSNGLFLFIVIIFITLLSMMLFSSAIFIYLYLIEGKKTKEEKKYNVEKKTIFIFLLLNSLMFFIVITGVISSPLIKWERDLLILIIIMYVTVHIIVHIVGDTRSKIKLHVILITCLSLSCVMPNKYISDIFSIGLKEFSVGGDIPATIYHQSARSGENVNIILHTPKALFFRKGNVVGLIPGDKINMIVYLKNTDNKEKSRN
ncbi:hypothetical protein [Pectobacterium carotovorum]|uniref:hypothetical protein n=1 Tax=Pectobacterium carotovorum TaxID=554 RepID=UPI001E3E1A07|nr:hypothetical protein [Pectobacterium carotovorum]UFT95004.1 hypothetical protein LQF52_02930 [Pectobacterium carotovorum]